MTRGLVIETRKDWGMGEAEKPQDIEFAGQLTPLSVGQLTQCDRFVFVCASAPQRCLYACLPLSSYCCLNQLDSFCLGAQPTGVKGSFGLSQQQNRVVLVASLVQIVREDAAK